jgi:hypothetical protein
MPIETVRKALLFILFLGFTGTWMELLLLKHTEGFWQLVPVVLTIGGTVLVAWCAISANRAVLRTLQVLSAVFLISGIVGVVQHFLGNIGYERESNPGLAGMELYKLAAMGSTPLLAPGVMLQLGLIGLLYTHRNPGLTRTES